MDTIEDFSFLWIANLSTPIEYQFSVVASTGFSYITVPVSVIITQTMSQPPLFVQPLETTLTYDMSKVTEANYTLPESMDPNGDDITIIVYFENIDIMSYDKEAQDIKFHNLVPGTYRIDITLLDQFSKNAYEIEVNIFDT